MLSLSKHASYEPLHAVADLMLRQAQLDSPHDPA